MKRPHGLIVAAGALFLVGLGVRLVIGPFPGGTALLLASCGLSLSVFLPPELSRASVRVAALPGVAIASFAILLTTVAILGIPLTEVSIRVAVALLVLFCALADQRGARDIDAPSAPSGRRVEAAVLAVLALLVAFAFAVGWDISGPFPSRGTDWGHYLLYADEVDEQEALLIDDRLSGDGWVFADSPGVGSLLGGAVIVDGVDSKSLSAIVSLMSALGLLGAFAFVASLWGAWAGVVATAAYAVAPIRIEPLYWYGLHTLLALTVVPLALLAVGLLYRGRRDPRVIGLLGLALSGVAVMHTTSALIVGMFVGIVVLVGLAEAGVRMLWHRASKRSDAGSRVLSGVLLGVGAACVVGAGVIVHLARQARELGEPVSYVFFEPDWLDLDAIVGYYSWSFIALTAVAIGLVLTTPRLRTDRALLTLAALVLACVVVSQLWRVEFPFEYRRVVYYVGLALVVVIGVAAVRLGRSVWTIAALTLVFAYIAHGSIGLRLPERLLASDESPDRQKIDALVELRDELDRGGVQGVVVADRCLHFIVPYLLGRRTLAAFEEWQVGFVNRLPAARRAGVILEGGDRGRRLAQSLDVNLVVVDPRCTPEPASGLGGSRVISQPELVVLQLPRS